MKAWMMLPIGLDNVAMQRARVYGVYLDFLYDSSVLGAMWRDYPLTA